MWWRHFQATVPVGKDYSYRSLHALPDGDLTHGSFNGSQLSHVTFKGRDITGCSFTNARLHHCDFTEAIGLNQNAFAGADLSYCTFPEHFAFDSLKTLEETAKAANIMFVTLVAATLYGLTARFTSDFNIVSDTALLKLPFIDIKVSATRFLTITPIILMVIFGYFQLHMRHLFQILSTLPAIFPQGNTLSQTAYPWLFVGMINYGRPNLQDPSRFRKLRAQSRIFAGWFFGPSIMFFFWANSLITHKYVTFFHLGLFALSLAYAIRFLVACLEDIGYIRPSKAPERCERERRDYQNYDPKKDAIRKLSVLRGFRSNDARGLSLAITTLLFALTIMSWEAYIPNDHRLLQPLVRYVSVVAPSGKFSGLETKHKKEQPDYTVSQPRKSYAGRHFIRGDLKYSDWRYTDLIKADFRFASLNYAQMQGVYLNQTRLQSADLSGAGLQHATIKNLSFNQTTLNGVNLEKASLEYVVFDQNEMVRTRFSGANLRHASLNQANLQHGVLNSIDWTQGALTHSNLQHASLLNGAFVKVDFSLSDFQNSILTKAAFDKCTFDRADMRRLDLSQDVAFSLCSFFETDLTKANLQGLRIGETNNFSRSIMNEMDATASTWSSSSTLEFAQLNKAVFTNAALIQVNASHIDAEYINLDQAKLNHATLNFANLKDASLIQANLTDTKLKKATLDHTVIKNADMTRSNLDGASFELSDLSGANLGGIKNWDQANWKHANVYEVTNPPEGFLSFAINQGAVSLPKEQWDTYVVRTKMERLQRR